MFGQCLATKMKNDKEKQKVVRNFSKRSLANEEIRILEEGLSYNRLSNINRSNVISNVEYLFHNTAGMEKQLIDFKKWDEGPDEITNKELRVLEPRQLTFASELRSAAEKFFRRQQMTMLSNKKMYADQKKDSNILLNLSKDPTIHITKPDKGRGVVILDCAEYINKLETILSDNKKFKILDEDPTITRESALTNLLRKMKTEEYLTTKEYNFIRPVGSIPARLKTKMISFDIESLFTNIPVQETIEIICNKLYCTDPKIRPYIPEHYFRKLLKFATTGTHFLFNKKYYEQCDGISMGTPLATIFSEIFMGYFEEINLPRLLEGDPPKLLLWRRYVDDTFILCTNQTDEEQIKSTLNTFHPCIRFTFEPEVKKQLPFLDVLITKQQQEFDTIVYRKSTSTFLMTKWYSIAPKSYKKSAVSALVNRAIRICSNPQLLRDELHHIRTITTYNRYPRQFVESIIDQQLTRSHEKNTPRSKATKRPKNIKYIELPYVANIKCCCNKWISLTNNRGKFQLSNFYRHLQDFRNNNTCDKMKELIKNCKLISSITADNQQSFTYSDTALDHESSSGTTTDDESSSNAILLNSTSTSITTDDHESLEQPSPLLKSKSRAKRKLHSVESSYNTKEVIKRTRRR
ncbi:unnamed protein product [Rotaria magnacalcarata]|uniref:Reverse transcriptase domain-containing protein n=3 Tax=Rotaria magnacalcarata TaxID=392030 RepID=A0A816LQ35_9BILA|nr:unnamed protein product [Rotaria magnacalcarata]CAF1937179.1 unnamed protein product [Rotaria magnacalcarata]